MLLLLEVKFAWCDSLNYEKGVEERSPRRNLAFFNNRIKFLKLTSWLNLFTKFIVTKCESFSELQINLRGATNVKECTDEVWVQTPGKSPVLKIITLDYIPRHGYIIDFRASAPGLYWLNIIFEDIQDYHHDSGTGISRLQIRKERFWSYLHATFRLALNCNTLVPSTYRYLIHSTVFYSIAVGPGH